MTVRVGEFATRAEVRRSRSRPVSKMFPIFQRFTSALLKQRSKISPPRIRCFPNNGVRRQPYIIESIQDRYGKTIYKATRAELRCINPDVDYVMNELLRDVIRKGTATADVVRTFPLPAKPEPPTITRMPGLSATPHA